MNSSVYFFIKMHTKDGGNQLKLRTKIILLASVPVILLGVILFFIASLKIRDGISDEAYRGMHATTLAVRDIFENASEGEYRVDENNQLWKGDLNISESEELVDQIKENTGMDVTVFYGDTRYLTTIVDTNGNRQINTTASEIVSETVLKQGKDYKDDNVDIFGTRYICYYIPVYSTDGGTTPIGMIFLGQEFSNVNLLIKSAQGGILISGLVVAVLTILLAAFVGILIIRALKRGMNTVQNIAGGKLGVHIDEKLLKRNDIIGNMCRDIENLDRKLCTIISQIQEQCELLNNTAISCTESSTNVMEATRQINQTTQGIAGAATMQAQDASDAGNNVTVMGNMIGDTSNNIEELTRLLEEMGNATANSQAILVELNQSMQDVKEAVEDITNKTSSTHESVKRISEATNVITKIATQTNLLSLNASIEAARAGEQGKGFAVVASEIQQLAEQSNQSARDIQSILSQLIMDSESSVNTMGEVSQTISIQETKIKETNEAFSIVDDGIHKSVEGIEQIEEKMRTLDDARSETVAVVQNVASIAEENAASTEEMASTVDQVNDEIEVLASKAKKLNDIASVLQNQIDTFEIV